MKKGGKIALGVVGGLLALAYIGDKFGGPDIYTDGCAFNLQNKPELFTEARQNDRAALLVSLKSKKIIHNVSERTEKAIYIDVTPVFKGMPYEDKKATVAAITAYYCGNDKKTDLARLRDAATHKEVGLYTFAGGLELN